MKLSVKYFKEKLAAIKIYLKFLLSYPYHDFILLSLIKMYFARIS